MASRPSSSGHPPSRFGNPHRTNDVVLGHAGRVSYIPRDLHPDHHVHHQLSDELGDVHINRTVDNIPSLHQATPFSEWYPPSRATDSAFTQPTGLRAQRSQQNWLLKTYPEALLGFSDLRITLNESAVDRHAEQWELQHHHARSPRRPLLSLGSINDRTYGEHVAVCPAVAVACGEAGDFVRISALRNVEHALGDGGTLALAAPDSRFEGYWRADGVPVSQVKFFSFKNGRVVSRWLIVQTAYATVLIEPEVQAIPVWNNFGDAEEYSGPSYISMTPFLTLTQTGGGRNADFAFCAGDGDEPPRLAVVDCDGSWTVWDLPAKRRKQGAMVATRRCSGWAGSMPSELPVPGYENGDDQCLAVWMAPIEQEAQRSGILYGTQSSLPEAGDASQKHPGCLVICTRTTLSVVNIKQGRSEPQTLEPVVESKRFEGILDMASCLGDLSKMFVLTSTRVFWLELRKNRDEVDAVVLLSCPHLRSPIDHTLRMAVTRVADPDRNGESTWLVCLFSGEGTARTTLFWFTKPLEPAQATFHRQTDHFNRSSDQAPIRSVLLSPLTSGPAISASRLRNFHLAQCLVLDSNLGLQRGLQAVVFSGGRGRKPPRIPDFTSLPDPGQLHESFRTEVIKRKRILAHMRDGFVIRDEYSIFFEQGRLFKRQLREWEATEEMQVGNDATVADVYARERKYPLYDLSPVLKIVIDRVDARVAVVAAADEDNEGSGVFSAIGDVIKGGFDQRHLRLITLLEASGGAIGSLEMDVQSSRWSDELQQLRESAQFAEDDDSERLWVTDLAIGAFLSDPASLYERLLHMWTSTLPENISNHESSRTRELMIGQIAMEVFLAQTGIIISPPPPPPPVIVKKDELSQGPSHSSQQSMDTGLPSPSATPTPSSRASSEVRTLGITKPEDSDDEGSQNDFPQFEQDPAAIRLARYAVSIGTIPRKPNADAESNLLAHWPAEAGSDPGEFTWSWAAASQRRLEERLAAKKLAKEARKRRNEDKRVLYGIAEMANSAGEGSGRRERERAAPRIAHSSQVAPQVMSSQAPQTPGRSAVVMSQRLGTGTGTGRKRGRGGKSGFR